MNGEREEQRRITRLALQAAGQEGGFALAGSGAIREHGLIDRPTEDVFSQVGVLFFVRYFFRVYAGGMRPVVYCLVLPNMSASFMRRLGPVNSMRRPWWMMRSMIAAASLSSAKIVPHLLNSMLVVKMMLRGS